MRVLNLCACVYIYIYIYQSEGFPLRGYFIPGHVGIWVWLISKLVLHLLPLLPCVPFVGGLRPPTPPISSRLLSQPPGPWNTKSACPTWSWGHAQLGPRVGACLTWSRGHAQLGPGGMPNLVPGACPTRPNSKMQDGNLLREGVSRNSGPCGCVRLTELV